MCPTTGKKQEYRHLIAEPQMCHTWDNGMYDELGKHTQDNKLINTKGTNTVNFVHPNIIHNYRAVANIRIVVDI